MFVPRCFPPDIIHSWSNTKNRVGWGMNVKFALGSAPGPVESKGRNEGSGDRNIEPSPLCPDPAKGSMDQDELALFRSDV